MDMRLDIPFYPNTEDGNQCFQVAMQVVLKHFSNKEYSLSELDELTQRKPGKWTWTPQIVPVLHDLGLDIRFFSATSLEPYLEGKPFIHRHFGKDAEVMLKYTDVDILVNSIKKLLRYDLFEKRKLTFEEIEQHIIQGHVPLVIIDFNKLVEREGPYQGHFVVITGFDDEFVYYHESGPHNPTPNRKVPKQNFINGLNANGTDNDVVIVLGRKT